MPRIRKWLSDVLTGVFMLAPGPRTKPAELAPEGRGVRMFPVLFHARKEFPDCPASVPWSLLAPHEARAKRNHDQTLERLAERCGLSPYEMRCVLLDIGLWDDRVDDRVAIDFIKASVAAHDAIAPAG